MRLVVLLALVTPLSTNGGSVPQIADVIRRINPGINEARAATIEKSIVRFSNAYGVDPKLVAAMAAVESRFNDKAVGASHGEIGLMQLRPEFHATHIKNMFKRKKYLFGIENNVGTAAKFISELKKGYEEKYGPKYIELYNRGPASEPKKFPYASKVFRAYRAFGGLQ